MVASNNTAQYKKVTKKIKQFAFNRDDLSTYEIVFLNNNKNMKRKHRGRVIIVYISYTFWE